MPTDVARHEALLVVAPRLIADIVHRLPQIDQVPELTFQSLLLLLGFPLELLFLDGFDVGEDVLLVSVEEAELLITYLATSVVVDDAEDALEVLDGQLDALELAAAHELFQAQGTILIGVKGLERLAIVAELLLDALVDPLQNFLQVHLLFYGPFAFDVVFLENLIGAIVEQRIPNQSGIIALVAGKHRTVRVYLLQ